MNTVHHTEGRKAPLSSVRAKKAAWSRLFRFVRDIKWASMLYRRIQNRCKSYLLAMHRIGDMLASNEVDRVFESFRLVREEFIKDLDRLAARLRKAISGKSVPWNPSTPDLFARCVAA